MAHPQQPAENCSSADTSASGWEAEGRAAHIGAERHLEHELLVDVGGVCLGVQPGIDQKLAVPRLIEESLCMGSAAPDVS